MAAVGIADVLQIVSVGILTGIFFRLGAIQARIEGHGATLDDHGKRITKMERKPT